MIEYIHFDNTFRPKCVSIFDKAILSVIYEVFNLNNHIFLPLICRQIAVLWHVCRYAAPSSSPKAVNECVVLLAFSQ